MTYKYPRGTLSMKTMISLHYTLNHVLDVPDKGSEAQVGRLFIDLL